jgi:hypothetical protein
LYLSINILKIIYELYINTFDLAIRKTIKCNI